ALRLKQSRNLVECSQDLQLLVKQNGASEWLSLRRVVCKETESDYDLYTKEKKKDYEALTEGESAIKCENLNWPKKKSIKACEIMTQSIYAEAGFKLNVRPDGAIICRGSHEIIVSEAKDAKENGKKPDDKLMCVETADGVKLMANLSSRLTDISHGQIDCRDKQEDGSIKHLFLYVALVVGAIITIGVGICAFIVYRRHKRAVAAEASPSAALDSSTPVPEPDSE
ncbi:hypothetical protein PFISCL1PPCAC_5121, partial [Pristionchus fissidentatus]